jgi:hypothetical protein
VVPVPPTPPVIAADASEADRVTAKTADDAAVDAYDQQVGDFSEALSTYRDAQTLLILSGVMRMPVLRLFLLLVCCPSLLLSSWLFLLLMRCGIIFANGISPLVTLSICLWSVRSMLSSRVIPVLRSSTHRVQLFGVSLTLSALLSVVLVPVAGL